MNLSAAAISWFAIGQLPCKLSRAFAPSCRYTRIGCFAVGRTARNKRARTRRARPGFMNRDCRPSRPFVKGLCLPSERATHFGVNESSNYHEHRNKNPPLEPRERTIAKVEGWIL